MLSKKLLVCASLLATSICFADVKLLNNNEFQEMMSKKCGLGLFEYLYQNECINDEDAQILACMSLKNFIESLSDQIKENKNENDEDFNKYCDTVPLLVPFLYENIADEKKIR